MDTRAHLPVVLALAVLACGESASGPPTSGPPVLTSIDIALPDSAKPFMVHDTAQLVVSGKDQTGHPFAVAAATWQSRSPAVIAIDGTGKIVGGSTGAATLVASVGAIVDSLVVNVAGTRHRGAITSDETWTLAGSPHAVRGFVSVGGTTVVTLTIEAGVTVLFDQNASLTLGFGGPGALLAQGTPSAPIMMRSTDAAATPGAWVGLTFRSGNLSELHHVNLSSCGRYPLNGLPAGCLVVGDGVAVTAPTLLVDDVTIHDGSAAGVVLQGPARFAAGSSALSVQNMRGEIAVMSAGAAAGFPVGGILSGNDINRVYLFGDSLRDSATWNPTIPWGVVNPVIIEGPNQPVLTIPAGATLRMRGGFVVGRNAPGGLRIGADGGSQDTLRAESSTWGGIDFGPYALNSSITDAVLQGCGASDFTRYGSGCVYIVGSVSGGPAPAPVIKNVTIRNAVDFGVALNNGGRFGAGSANLTITGTGGSGFATGTPFILNQSSPGSIPVGQYTGNLSDEIWVNQLDLADSDTWHARGVPYLVYGIISVGGDSHPTLSIDSGVTVLVAGGGPRFLVGMDKPGAFRAIGTASAPVTLNGQSNAPGGWVGIVFGPYADSASALDHAIVDHAGAPDPWIAGAIHFYRDLGEIMRNTVISNSSSCGVIIVNQPPWSTDFTSPGLGNSFVDNVGAAQCGP